MEHRSAAADHGHPDRYRRVRRLQLTDAGAELHSRLLAAVIELQQHVLAGLGPQERAALRKTLETIQTNLAALGAPAPAA